MNPENNSPAYVYVFLTVAKNAIGADLEGGLFEFGLYNPNHELIQTKSNAPDGIIKFAELTFTSMGVHEYYLKEISAPDGWEEDTKEYPIIISIESGGPTGLTADVSYPEGMPGFKNTRKGAPCSLIEFPELTFDAPGEYEFTIKELTPSGGGWTTDGKEVTVIVTVTDDGYGNLIATVEYKGGFPEFTNVYKTKPAHIIISAIKKAVGAQLPCGRFEFGLFDEDGELVAKVFNKNS